MAILFIEMLAISDFSVSPFGYAKPKCFIQEQIIWNTEFGEGDLNN